MQRRAKSTERELRRSTLDCQCSITSDTTATPPPLIKTDGELPAVGSHYLYRWVDKNDYLCEVFPLGFKFILGSDVWIVCRANVLMHIFVFVKLHCQYVSLNRNLLLVKCYALQVLECETSQVHVRFMRQTEGFFFWDSCPEESWENVPDFLSKSRKVNLEMDTKRSTNRRQLYLVK